MEGNSDALGGFATDGTGYGLGSSDQSASLDVALTQPYDVAAFGFSRGFVPGVVAGWALEKALDYGWSVITNPDNYTGTVNPGDYNAMGDVSPGTNSSAYSGSER